VLVVEDEATLRPELEALLEDLGFEAVPASDGPTALALADAASPARLAAAVVDLHLPSGGLDGREVVRRLRAARPGLPVVVATGPGTDTGADLRGLGGPTRRLRRPYACGDLRAALGEVLALEVAGRADCLPLRELLLRYYAVCGSDGREAAEAADHVVGRIAAAISGHVPLAPDGDPREEAARRAVLAACNRLVPVPAPEEIRRRNAGRRASRSA
jgi:CheY-like chemotaxis protein